MDRHFYVYIYILLMNEVTIGGKARNQDLSLAGLHKV